MPTKRVHDLPIKPNRVAINRDDPKQGEGVFVNLVNSRAAEQVTPNGIQWQNDYDGPLVNYELPRTEGGDMRPHGNRARSPFAMGGHNTINDNQGGGARRRWGGNRSGE